MSYTTAVTDRTAADLVARNSKAFINVADFTRIYGNSLLVQSLLYAAELITVDFETLATPTIITIPTVEEYNTLAGNIEAIRFQIEIELATIPGATTEIKHDYEAGASKETFDYRDVNLWESTLDVLWEYFDGPLLDVCPTLTGDLTVLTGAQDIYIDCIDMDGFNIDLQGTANLFII